MAKWIMARTYKVWVGSDPVEADTKEEATAKFDALAEKGDIVWNSEISVEQLNEFGDVEDETIEEEE